MVPEEWSSLESSNLKAMRYDAQQAQLYVRFINGSTYMYDNVPPEDAEGLYHASSPGGYLRENIIGVYTHQRV